MGLFTRVTPYVLPFPPVVSSLDDARFLKRGAEVGAEIDAWMAQGGALSAPLISAHTTHEEFRSVMLAAATRAMYIGLSPAWEYQRNRKTYGFLEYRGDHNPVGSVLMNRAGDEFDESVQALTAARLQHLKVYDAAAFTDEGALAALNAVGIYLIPMPLTVRQGEVSMYAPPAVPELAFRYTAYFMEVVLDAVLRQANLSAAAFATYMRLFGDHAVRASGRLFEGENGNSSSLPDTLQADDARAAWIQRTTAAACALADTYSPSAISTLASCYREPLGL